MRALLLLLLACGPSIGGIHARMGYSEESGLRVVDVPPGPAHDAGLQEDDRIMTIEGTPVRSLSMQEVVEQLRGPVGSKVSIEVVRDDEIVPLQIERVAYDR
ncbi:MAG: PDZ domain-containing protein [Myxococcota bacterium]